RGRNRFAIECVSPKRRNGRPTWLPDVWVHWRDVHFFAKAIDERLCFDNLAFLLNEALLKSLDRRLEGLSHSCTYKWILVVCQNQVQFEPLAFTCQGAEHAHPVKRRGELRLRRIAPRRLDRDKTECDNILPTNCFR